MKSSAKKKFIKELANVPIVSVAARAAGVSRQTVYRWMKENPDFEDFVTQAKQRGFDHINDITESQLITMIKEGKWAVIKYWLRHRHKDYREVNTRYQPVAEVNEAMTPEEAQAMEDMMAKFVGKKNEMDTKKLELKDE